MRNKSLLFMTLLFLFLGSCRKEGCMDEAATNFDPTANDDDFSCNYEGSIVFWMDEETSEYFQDNDIPWLDYYVSSSKVTYGQTSLFSSEGLPVCGEEEFFTADIFMTQQIQSFTYKVKDLDDELWWSGTVELKANECTPLQLKL